MKPGLPSRITLDQVLSWRVTVCGVLGDTWSAWGSGLDVAVEQGDGGAVTMLCGDMDQAALHGLLRQLYALGIPLLEVVQVADN